MRSQPKAMIMAIIIFFKSAATSGLSQNPPGSGHVCPWWQQRVVGWLGRGTVVAFEGQWVTCEWDGNGF